MKSVVISQSRILSEIESLTSQLKDLDSRANAVRERLSHLIFIRDNASTYGEDQLTPRAPRAKDQKDSTKSVLVSILKQDGGEMRWEQILEKFVKVRPDVKVQTMRVILSGLVSNPKSKVIKIKDGNNYRYQYSQS